MAGDQDSRALSNSNKQCPARLVIGLITGMLALVACTENLSTNRPYILTTATSGGTYYPVGVALATITKSQLHQTQGISLSAISSAGSMENIKLLRDNQAQFALLQGIFAAWAWNGGGPIKNPQIHLRSIAALWNNVEHFVLLNDLVVNGTVMDLDTLDGQRFVIEAASISSTVLVSTTSLALTWLTWVTVRPPMRFRTAPL